MPQLASDRIANNLFFIRYGFSSEGAQRWCFFDGSWTPIRTEYFQTGSKLFNTYFVGSIQAEKLQS